MNLPNRQFHILNTRNGFTLIELMITIVIVAVLATIGMTVYSQSQKVARDGKRIADMKEVQKALEQYYSINGIYMAADPANYNDPIGNNAALNPYFASNIAPSDPLPTNNSNANTMYRYYRCDNQERYIICASLEGSGGNRSVRPTSPGDACNRAVTNAATPKTQYCLGSISN